MVEPIQISLAVERRRVHGKEGRRIYQFQLTRVGLFLGLITDKGQLEHFPLKSLYQQDNHEDRAAERKDHGSQQNDQLAQPRDQEKHEKGKPERNSEQQPRDPEKDALKRMESDKAIPFEWLDQQKDDGGNESDIRQRPEEVVAELASCD